MKLNMGCGRNKHAGYVNVDSAPASEPDVLFDLETFPWPWPDGAAEEVVFNHSLEHMGGDPKVFLRLMQELYRICAPGAVVRINVPHPRHDDFIGDPTHVRPITPQMLTLFDRELNDRWRAGGFSNTPLAHYLGVDFRLTTRGLILDEPYLTQLQRGEVSEAQVLEWERQRNNVVREFRIELVARK